MLVLQRYPGQSIWVGDNIQITILGNSNGVTRVGIEAPREVRITRDEIKDTEPRHEQRSVITQTHPA